MGTGSEIPPLPPPQGWGRRPDSGIQMTPRTRATEPRPWVEHTTRDPQNSRSHRESSAQSWVVKHQMGKKLKRESRLHVTRYKTSTLSYCFPEPTRPGREKASSHLEAMTSLDFQNRSPHPSLGRVRAFISIHLYLSLFLQRSPLSMTSFYYVRMSTWGVQAGRHRHPTALGMRGVLLSFTTQFHQSSAEASGCKQRRLRGPGRLWWCMGHQPPTFSLSNPIHGHVNSI